jgi:alpha-N-arabinofuranosidase
VTFDVFNRHADKVAMANVAQTINCIHSLFLAQGDHYTRTPVYYVFEMYKGHMGARSAPMRVRCDELTVPGGAGTVKMPGLSGSASLKDGRLLVTLANPSLDSPVTTRIRLTAGNAAEARGTVLTHADMTARNTFDQPENVKLAPLPVNIKGGTVEVAIPQHAVASIEVRVS